MKCAQIDSRTLSKFVDSSVGRRKVTEFKLAGCYANKYMSRHLRRYSVQSTDIVVRM